MLAISCAQSTQRLNAYSALIVKEYSTFGIQVMQKVSLTFCKTIKNVMIPNGRIRVARQETRSDTNLALDQWTLKPQKPALHWQIILASWKKTASVWNRSWNLCQNHTWPSSASLYVLAVPHWCRYPKFLPTFVIPDNDADVEMPCTRFLEDSTTVLQVKYQFKRINTLNSELGLLYHPIFEIYLKILPRIHGFYYKRLVFINKVTSKAEASNSYW